MVDATTALTAAGAGVLVVGLGYGSLTDLRTREVPDQLWWFLGTVGLLLGVAVIGFTSALALGLWIGVGLFALEQTLPWDLALGSRWDRYVVEIEAATYLAVILAVAIAIGRYGIGPSGVPLAVVALLATVLIARGLFELEILYGYADAKGMMVTGLLVPLFPVPLAVMLSRPEIVTGFLPFSLTMLTNAALLSIAVPLGLAIRNFRRGEFTFPRGFLAYTLPPRELPYHYVWIRDPEAAGDLDTDGETSEEDARIRQEAAQILTKRGVERVWVGPQIPFVVLMALGAVAGMLVGNLLLDLIALL